MSSNLTPEVEKNPYLSLDSDEEKQHSEEESQDLSKDLLAHHFEKYNKTGTISEKEFYQRSFEIFSQLNDCIKGNDSSELKDTKKSEIEGVIQDYVDLIHDCEDDSQRSAIWDLASILYFSQEKHSLASRLNIWLQQNTTSPKGIHDIDEEDTDLGWIWDSARRFLLRGDSLDAAAVLEYGLGAMDEAKANAVKTLISLIRKFHDMQDHNDNHAAYNTAWTAWNHECLLERDNFMGYCDDKDKMNDEILEIYNVLLGEEETLFGADEYYERVVGSLYFSKPLTTLRGLCHIAQNAVQASETMDACQFFLMGWFDDALNKSNDPWLQTHLGHALLVTDIKSSDLGQRAVSDREIVTDPIYHCIQIYAISLADEHNMWKEAVIYISACAENREIWFKELLNETALKPKDMEFLNNMLDITIKEKMSNAQKYIHKIMGKRYEHTKEIRKATIEYAKAQDLHALDRLAHVEFSHYLKTGKLGQVVTDTEQVNQSPHYHILVLYHNFKSHLGKKEFDQAAQLLLQILQCEHLPTKFEIVLLIDNVVILEDRNQHYNPKEMMKLIELIKRVSKDKANEDFLSKHYELVRSKKLEAPIVMAKLRERIVYKASIANN